MTQGESVQTLTEIALASLLIGDVWTVPPPPTGLDVSPTPRDPTRSLSASWDAPSASPSVQSYHVDHRLQGVVDWSRNTVPASETSMTVGGLKAGMDYRVRVLAENAVGEGRPTGIAPVSTQALPCAPGGPRVTRPGGGADTELAVEWKAAADCGATIDRYRVRYRRDPAREEVTDNWSKQAVSQVSTTLQGLVSGTWYVVQIHAESDAAGMSRWSPEGSGRTKGVPDRVERPEAIGGDRSISVDWDAPPDGGYSITDYDVWYQKSDQTDWSTHAFECDGAGNCPTATTISSGLDPDTTYNVQVRAQNSSGPGKWSRPATAKTLKLLSASFASADYAVDRGATVTVAVVLSPSSDREVPIPVTTAPATGNFTLAPSVAHFMVGEDSKSLTFTAEDSTNPETVTLRFGTLPSGVIDGATPTATVTIAGGSDPAPVCGPTENSCRTGTLEHTDDTPPTSGACAATEAEECAAGNFSNRSDRPLENGACGSTTDRCSDGTFSNRSDTTSEHRWACLGVDGAKLWRCLGTNGSKNWNCASGTELEQCSVADPAASDSCSETTEADRRQLLKLQ